VSEHESAAARFREIAEWDWIVFTYSRVLHAAKTFAVIPDWEVSADGITACGRAGRFHIPGMGTRMSYPRCTRCCVALGYPPGTGSPKNDPACRPLVEARLAAWRDVPAL
jgi:hypothetical protein